MQTTQSSVWCVALLVGLMAVPPSAVRAEEWFVSPTGNDSNSGTRADPFASPARAMQEVRSAVARGLKSDIRVVFAAGTYELSAPLVFTPADSGTAEHAITYAAAPGSRVIFSGGRRIANWKSDGRTWTAELPEVRSSGWFFRQLVVNGERAVRARWPDEDGVLHVAEVSNGVRTFTFDRPLPAGIVGGEEGELVMYQNWSVSRARVVSSTTNSLTTETGVGWIGHGDMTTASPGKPAFLEHCRAALDQPGEWFLDRKAGVLHYLGRDGQDPASTEVFAPVLSQLVKIAGTREQPVRNVRFEGLQFAHTDFALPAFGYSEIQAAHFGPRKDETTFVQPLAVECLYADGIRFDRCRFAHLNASGLGFGAGCTMNRVNHCTVEDIGGNGIMVGWRGVGRLRPGIEGTLDGDWADPADAPVGNEVVDCAIRRCGEDSRGAVGIWVGFSADTRIVGNDVQDLPYTGISVGYRWDTTPTTQARCVVESNHIYDVMKKLADGAGIYTLGWQPGTILRGNHIHDVHRSRYAHGGAPNNGFFVDEGSKGFLFESNVVHDTSGESVRFNQCQREWHTWTGNFFDGAATPAVIAEVRQRESSRRAGAEGGSIKTGQASPPESPLTLWYRRPSERWTEALVLGNGRLGAMVWGGVGQERIDLNEDTLWSGEPYDNLNTNGLAALPTIRALLLAGKNAEAQALVERDMNGKYNQCYLPLGQLTMAFPFQGDVVDYRRELDLEQGVARVQFVHAGTRYLREVFASHPDQAIVVRLTSDQPGKLNFRASLESQLRHAVTTERLGPGTAAGDPNTLRLTGRAPVHADPSYAGKRVIYDETEEGKGMRFESRLVASHEGGTLRFSGSQLTAENCDRVTLILVAATSYNGPHRSPSREGRDPARICEAFLEPLRGKPFAALRDTHVADHQRLFQRVRLDLGRSDADALPTDLRVKRYESGADPSLAALYFQFGRYLTIAGSRPGTQPLNLQGIWNKDVNPAWSANWTLNCNAQINYWPVEVANLGECHLPLVDLTTDLSVDGTNIARNLYGARGWVAHHNTDIWRQAGPVAGSACWSVFQGGSAWLCQHLWEHYAFAADPDALRRVWPVLAGAARFYLDAMIAEPSRGWRVTAPDVNFENAFRKPDGSSACSCYGPTATTQMVRELFRNCLAAGSTIPLDPAFRAELEAALARLAPMQVSPTTGELQEWVEDWKRTAECQVLSSWGSVCSAQITPKGTPELAAGLRRIYDTANWWKNGAVGSWQGAFQANVYARLHDGDRALDVLDMHLRRVVNPNLTANFGGAAEWEIDGNLGLTAAICEMLIQSQAGEVELLPALPKSWGSGSVKGLRARGGFEVDLIWDQARLVEATVRSPRGGSVRLRCGERVETLELRPGETRAWKAQ